MWSTLSKLVGWTYVACWSVSFYPQVITNYKRQSVVGLSLDFVTYNVVGFFCYAAFTISVYPADARLNDIIFSVHAFLLTVVTALQCVIYDRAGQLPSMFCISVVGLIGIVASTFAIGLKVQHNGFLSWHNLLYTLSFVKLMVSVFKYIPQVRLNWKRKSTVGWSIGNIILDFTGGILSVFQVILDGLTAGDWSPVVNNPVKFMLGLTSMAFDVIFFVQHFVLYKHSDRYKLGSSRSSSSQRLNP